MTLKIVPEDELVNAVGTKLESSCIFRPIVNTHSGSR